MKRKGGFDAIIVETTGLADPGPVAQTFFVDEDVQGQDPARQRHHRGRRQAPPAAAGGHPRRRASRSPSPTRSCSTRPTSSPRPSCARSSARSAGSIRWPRSTARERSNVPLDAILGRGGFDLDADRGAGAGVPEPRPRRGRPRARRALRTTTITGTTTMTTTTATTAATPTTTSDIRGVSLTLDQPVDGQPGHRLAERGAAGAGARHPARQGHPRREGRGPAPGVPGRAHDPGGRLPARVARRRATAISRMVFIGRNLDEAKLQGRLRGLRLPRRPPTKRPAAVSRAGLRVRR